MLTFAPLHYRISKNHFGSILDPHYLQLMMKLWMEHKYGDMIFVVKDAYLTGEKAK